MRTRKTKKTGFRTVFAAFKQREPATAAFCSRRSQQPWWLLGRRSRNTMLLVEWVAGGVRSNRATVGSPLLVAFIDIGVCSLEKRRMSDPSITPPKDRFKADMPQIPGIHGALPKATRAGGAALVVAGLVAVLIAVFLGGRFLSKAQHSAPAAQPT